LRWEFDSPVSGEELGEEQQDHGDGHFAEEKQRETSQ